MMLMPLAGGQRVTGAKAKGRDMVDNPCCVTGKFQEEAKNTETVLILALSSYVGESTFSFTVQLVMCSAAFPSRPSMSLESHPQRLPPRKHLATVLQLAGGLTPNTQLHHFLGISSQRVKRRENVHRIQGRNLWYGLRRLGNAWKFTSSRCLDFCFVGAKGDFGDIQQPEFANWKDKRIWSLDPRNLDPLSASVMEFNSLLLLGLFAIQMQPV